MCDVSSHFVDSRVPYDPVAYFYFEVPSISGGGLVKQLSVAYFVFPWLIFLRGLFFSVAYFRERPVPRVPRESERMCALIMF